MATRTALIAEGGKSIHSRLREVNKTLKVSMGHPEWKAYVDFINNVLIDGLVHVATISLESLYNILKEEEEKVPLLTVVVNLGNSEVAFAPSTNGESKGTLKFHVKSWIEDLFSIGKAVKRLDGEGTYVREIESDTKVDEFLENIHSSVASNQGHCDEFKQQYEKFSFLWSTDLNEMFTNFLKEATISVSELGTVKLNLELFDKDERADGNQG